MNHGRLRELEWQRDDLWQRLFVLAPTVDAAGWRALVDDYEASCLELQRAL